MRHLVVACVLLSGCSLYPFDGGDDQCEIDLAQPAPERKVNPQTLTCEEFSYGGTCNADCGPCAEGGQGGAQYIPPWGRCESECSTLNEAGCQVATECRITRVHDAYYRNQPSFEGCYERTFYEGGETDAACETLDAEQCSRQSRCTGLYEMYGSAVPLHAPRGDFRGCIDEAQLAGTCNGVVTCRAMAPICPANTTPGVAEGCWTGSCIPTELCTPLGT